MNPLFLKDFYKVGHIQQYPKGTTLVFNNFTPRKSRMPGVNHSVFFGLEYFLKHYLKEMFDENFFNHGTAITEYHDFMHETLGMSIDTSHLFRLKEIGYLPIAIYALHEGTEVPCGCPALVMYNTHSDFYWLPQMLETIMSATLWGACTSATIAKEYRKLLDKYAMETVGNVNFVDYQAHDFSFRGMFGLEAAAISGMAHLNYFNGTDNIPAIIYAKKYYNRGLRVSSVTATEHAIMSAGLREHEFETYKRLITETYPSGIVSIVSDTWDLWNVVDNFLPRLKEDIIFRDGKVVIRPDSGDPVDIICGTDSCKGLIQRLWDIFNGTINAKGYKELDLHIGAIYGDSITIDRAANICEKLKTMGFASSNIVFGIGSYTYQYNTRDTLGWAMKATYCEINGVGRAITKDPITDDGTKKSHSGLLKVIKDSAGHFQLIQNCTWEDFHAPNNELNLKFLDGNIINGNN